MHASVPFYIYSIHAVVIDFVAPFALSFNPFYKPINASLANYALYNNA
jgi:hypothetical protein